MNNNNPAGIIMSGESKSIGNFDSHSVGGDHHSQGNIMGSSSTITNQAITPHTLNAVATSKGHQTTKNGTNGIGNYGTAGVASSQTTQPTHPAAQAHQNPPGTASSRHKAVSMSRESQANQIAMIQNQTLAQ